MPPEDRDAAYLWDMLDAARTIQEFTVGVSLDVLAWVCKEGASAEPGLVFRSLCEAERQVATDGICGG